MSRAAPVEGSKERRRASEVQAVATTTNVGYRLLASMGWKEGEGLGVDKQGRTEPVATCLKRDRAGLGATTLVYRVTHVESPPAPVAQQPKTTPAEKRWRKDAAAKQQQKERRYALELYGDDDGVPAKYQCLWH